jgi:hypothetical protein
MRSLQVIQRPETGRLQPSPPPFHLPCCLSFWSVVLSYHISHRNHRFPPQSPEIPLSFMLSLAIVFGHPREPRCFWIPPPPLPPILIFIHLPIYRIKLAWMAAFLHSFKSWYFLEALPCTFSMLNTHSPCSNAFRMVIRYLNPPGCTAGQLQTGGWNPLLLKFWSVLNTLSWALVFFIFYGKLWPPTCSLVSSEEDADTNFKLSA